MPDWPPGSENRLASQLPTSTTIRSEAMASGLPCIASSLPGITDVIVEDGVNGVLVPPGDVERLADALRAMAREPEHAHELGRRARQTIEAKYTIDVTAARHLDVYHSLVPTCEAGAKAC